GFSQPARNSREVNATSQILTCLLPLLLVIYIRKNSVCIVAKYAFLYKPLYGEYSLEKQMADS
ncbi:hypothetical protein QTO02_07445, partial [Vibrio fortis]